ncbi:MAG: tetratricopeptide repeat protein [Planctomycetes bacterium]|nr:tetratricopeptide repeat protein [Planctomycetota bacterium]
MSRQRELHGVPALALAGLLLAATPAWALKYDTARAAFEAGDFAKAERLLADEVRDNPGHEEAYLLWARALEQTDNLQGAMDAWTTLKKITLDEDREADARRNMLRLQRRLSDGRSETPKTPDPFHVPGIEIDYDGLEEVESKDYNGIYPPFSHETRNFMVYACNEKLAKKVGELSETYLEFLRQRLLAGRAWAFRVPIFVYANRDDYVKVGGWPAQSIGATYATHLGRSGKVGLFQISSAEEMESTGAKNPVSHNIEDVLPHELTHVVLYEFFGAQKVPKWLHEAFARQMEQNRKDYEEAAVLAQDAVAGEYFRFRDFFAAETYPSGGQVMRFYEQAATTVLFLIEQGPEATRAFLTELAKQKGHDAAVAAAFGIDEEGAVEAFEEMWVKWMEQRYIHDLQREDREEPTVAKRSDSRLFKGPFDELASLAKIEKWRDVRPDAEGECKGVGGSLGDWTLEAERIVSQLPDERTQSMLAIRMYEELPIAIRCRIRWTGDEEENLGWFGFALLDEHLEDLGAQALVRLDDNRAHDLYCVISDDIVVFLDDHCAGRYPLPPRSDEVEIDYPVALVAYSPVEITELQVATIEGFEATSDDDGDSVGDSRSKPPAKTAGKGKSSGGDKGKKKAGKKKPKKKKPKKRAPRQPPGVR